MTHTAFAPPARQRSMHSIQHSKKAPAVRTAIFFQCTCFAPGRLSLVRGEPSPAFPVVLVPLLPRRSGVGTRGDRKWICWREWRCASPYLLPYPSDLAGKPARRSLSLGAWRFTFHPRRRVNVRAPSLCPHSRQ